jgi:hypothetical protein
LPGSIYTEKKFRMNNRRSAMRSVLCGVFCVLLFVGTCTYIESTGSASYRASIVYQQRNFSGGSLSGQSVMVLPILSKKGFDTTAALGASECAALLSGIRGDIKPVFRDEFEKRYLAGHDSASLANFYNKLASGEVIALGTSDSVWKAMDAAYCSVVRIKNALTIKGFDGVVKRRLILETELWDVDSSETVLRVEVQGKAGQQTSDVDFIRAALRSAFEKLPAFAPASHEKAW